MVRQPKAMPRLRSPATDQGKLSDCASHAVWRCATDKPASILLPLWGSPSQNIVLSSRATASGSCGAGATVSGDSLVFSGFICRRSRIVAGCSARYRLRQHLENKAACLARCRAHRDRASGSAQFGLFRRRRPSAIDRRRRPTLDQSAPIASPTMTAPASHRARRKGRRGR